MNSDLERTLLYTNIFSETTQNNIKNNFNKLYDDDFRPYSSHRIFTNKEKEECWKLARVIPYRDPKRWRYDAIGNPVLKVLRGCMGALCHEYDHVYPHSKGGQTKLNNCQVLQSKVNRIKSNKLNFSHQEMIESSIKLNLTEDDMDKIEQLVYGDVKKLRI